MRHWLWLDMEMSGLDPEKEKILEVACIVTDLDFNPVDQFEAVVFQSQDVLDGMDAWCKEHHGKSGLTAKVPGGISEQELDEKLLALVQKHYPDPKSRVIICGNSIGQDRKFIDKYLPKFAARLHYRMLDVSSWKVVFEVKWNHKFKKQNKHRALEDIEESIRELKEYLSFLTPPVSK